MPELEEGDSTSAPHSRRNVSLDEAADVARRRQIMRYGRPLKRTKTKGEQPPVNTRSWNWWSRRSAGPTMAPIRRAFTTSSSPSRSTRETEWPAVQPARRLALMD